MTSEIDFSKIPSPCYVLEEKRLHDNLKTMDMVQKASGAKIICALKGFAMFSTFPLVSKYLPGTTASSLHEARLGYEEFGKEVHAYSPVYLEHEFEELMSYCGHITFNSMNQWEKYKSVVAKADRKISCALRINPEYSEVTTDLYNPCIPGSRLGLTADKFGDELPEGIDGLHFHTLCESSAESLEKTLEAVEEKFGHLLHQAKWLNMGGGHAITRKGYDLDLLITLITNLKENYDLEIILEPGSAVGWETGYLLSTVVDIVENQGVKSAMLDTSFSAHMPDTIEMPYQPKIWGSEKSSEGEYVYKMGGLTCLAGDVMGNYAFEKPLEIGQQLIFDDMIHYTMVKNHTFNGVNLPSIGIWTEEGEFKLVRKFGYEDYRNRLS
ncbi:carboxynorspermidine decarboxylase [Chondrinema litorale]|uniref:carboxynorspermidine decarboxylase n=1 Tax=Chondrinema litorale TaxID=2994555 RepID=UPI0025440E8D|nr:carboxynorspermidine decarboxylase [Chondrinema litorale]UZR94896.1 carboxynorspermidine decarboxylase [Chondrinema litorale]